VISRSGGAALLIGDYRIKVDAHQLAKTELSQKFPKGVNLIAYSIVKVILGRGQNRGVEETRRSRRTGAGKIFQTKLHLLSG
jgi:hypothetical protein